MYLKEIRAFGFKSFADKTIIEFCPNLNGIVGPNGSGKSNVVDAVRWVLGEQSIKSLRGDNATDVIFSGSKSRKPLNSASVTLIFDNSNKHLPLDFNEVSIKRVLFRSGESEYYINNEKCRLKDITDLLTDSGTAKESYNIISQGKIDEILSTKPEARRVIFEEAAGVLKYKRRKEEALRKLERTNLNLNRINDIISELETNLEPLKCQAEDAKIYNEAKDELSSIEIALISNDIEKYNYEYKELKSSLTILNDEISELSSNSSNYDVNIVKEKEKLAKIDLELNEKQTQLLELTKKQEQIDSDIKLLKERLKYVKEEDNTNNLTLLKENEYKINDNLNSLNNDIALNNKKIEVTNSSLKSNVEKYNDLKKNIDSTNNELIKNNRLLTDYKYKIEQLEISINNNSSLPRPVKSILDNPKFNGIHNVIGKLITMDSKYSIAISTSLGASSSYLVVDNPSIAKELVNYLKDNNIGRATFFPLNIILPRGVDEEIIATLKDDKSFINTADKLVEYKEMYRNVILNQLGNVIVVDNIDSANRISKKINHRYKIVTIDGQVVNVGGSITGGNNVTYNNVIKEKYELDNYQNEIVKLDNKNKELEKKITNFDREIKIIEPLIYEDRLLINEYNEIIKSISTKITDLENELNSINKEISDLNNISNNKVDNEEDKLLKEFYFVKEQITNINKEIEVLKLEKDKTNNSIIELENTSKSSNNYILKKEREANNIEIKISKIDVRLDTLLLELTEEYNMTFDNAKENYKLEIEENIAREKVNTLKDKIKNIGIVNLGAIEEYERVNTRYEFLTKQKKDLNNAEDTLLEIIKEMDETMETKFLETFNIIKEEFKKVFRELFKGGNAELILTDPDNLLETGIEIKAEPSGKNLKSISLLSGGEKTFTAISLLFAILNVREVPFCLFDEVEAALDDTNVESFGNYLAKYKDKTQFILITHKKKTMEYVDILYGITMQESGVSKLVSVKLEDLKEKNKN